MFCFISKTNETCLDLYGSEYVIKYILRYKYIGSNTSVSLVYLIMPVLIYIDIWYPITNINILQANQVT